MRGILILTFLPARLSWVKRDCTHVSTCTCVQTEGWKSWSPWVMNQCNFPQGVRDGISKQVHQEQLQQACQEGCHQPAFQIVSQMMTFHGHLFSLYWKVGSPLSSIQHVQHKEHAVIHLMLYSRTMSSHHPYASTSSSWLPHLCHRHVVSEQIYWHQKRKHFNTD